MKRANVTFSPSDIRTGDPFVAENLPLVRAAQAWTHLAPTSDIESFYVLVELRQRLERTPEAAQLAQDVQALIAATLHAEIRAGESTVHRNLAHQLWFNNLGQPKPRIITLNWDMVLEAAIRDSLPGNHVDYCLGTIRCDFHASPTADESERLRVMKLHGSLNWITCPECGLTAVDQKVTSGWWKPGIQCPNCQGPAQRLLVPPSSQKLTGVEDTRLPDLWLKARQELQACTDLALVGYSLPRTDVQFQMFLLEALASNTSLKRLCVVSEPKFGSARQAHEDHFSRGFSGSPHHHKLTFRYLRFEDWVEDKCRLFEVARMG